MPARMGPRTVEASISYMSDQVPRSLTSTGRVYVDRKVTGTDNPPVGLDQVPVVVTIADGREEGHTLDRSGFTLAVDPLDHIDYLDEQQILDRYYQQCCDLVKRVTGARRVHAFDHNVRMSQVVGWLNAGPTDAPQPTLKGGNAVQPPAGVVHNDYSLTSAPLRVRQLAEPPRANDTLAKVLKDQPLIPPDDLPGLMAGRWALINVWRNISAVPVADMPLALCEGPSVPPEDLITFEVRYVDRTGENYFLRHTPGHRWVFFPQATRDEAILLKVWDSHGDGFAAPDTAARVPATFTPHTAFKDPTAPADAPGRQSIEVRTVAFY